MSRGVPLEWSLAFTAEIPTNQEELEEAVMESFDIRPLSIPKGFLQPEILGTGKPAES